MSLFSAEHISAIQLDIHINYMWNSIEIFVYNLYKVINNKYMSRKKHLLILKYYADL